MDPTPRRPDLDKLETWLRYYNDLGIRSFFRDRMPLATGATGAAQAAADTAPEHIDTRTDTPEEDALKQRKKPAPPVTPPAAADRRTGAPAVSDVQGMAQGMAHGPSLFEVVDRVAGDTLERTCSDLGECTRCKLHRHRNKIVFGAGNPKAELMFIGEGPGHDEDLQGLPFVGRAGQLLTQMIEAMGLSRGDVYIANVVKCRPPENRAPEKDEVASCMPFLLRQIASIQPKAIVCLGSVAMQALLNTNKAISRLRGEWIDFRGSRLMPTYHPAYLLRNPHAKPEVWTDLKKVMAYLGLKPPVRGGSRP
jgi:uracil-DNA glycosylase